jgi:hypothetical protein
LEALENRTTPALFWVNTLADTINHSDNLLSLREALQAVNGGSLKGLSAQELRQVSAAQGALGHNDTVQFQVEGELALAGPLTLERDVTLRGPGSAHLTVYGQGQDNVFTVEKGVNARIEGLSITGGQSHFGGGIDNFGALAVVNSALFGNQADFGGGIYNEAHASLEVIDSTLSHNNADHNGGGIYNEASASLQLVRSTLWGNDAGQHGGGVYNHGTLEAVNATLSGNRAGFFGGGIYNTAGTLELADCTLSGNQADGGPSNKADAGGGIYTNGETTLNNSIVANSVHGGDIVSNGKLSGSHNLVEDGSGLPGWLRGDPGLGELRDNGGPTWTHALLPGSQAIDRGDNALVPDGVVTDQRGGARIVGKAVDLGAVEFDGSNDGSHGGNGGSDGGSDTSSDGGSGGSTGGSDGAGSTGDPGGGSGGNPDSGSGGSDTGSDGGSDTGSTGGSDTGSNGGSDGAGSTGGSGGGSDIGSTDGSDGGSDGGWNGESDGGSDTGSDAGSTGDSDHGSDRGSTDEPSHPTDATGPIETTVPPSPIGSTAPVAPRLPPVASGVHGPVEDALAVQPNADCGAQVPSLPDAAPVRDLAFLPQHGNAPRASTVNSLVVDALMVRLNAAEAGQLPGVSGAPVRDPASLPQEVATAGTGRSLADPGGSNQDALADLCTDQSALADVQGNLFGDSNDDGHWSEGESGLSGRAVRLVNEQGEVVAETTTGPEGEYHFAGVKPGRYRVEAAPSPKWGGKVSPAFTVSTGTVTEDPLGLPPAGDAAEEGGLPPAEGALPAETSASFAAADALWVLLGAALPAVNGTRGRRPAARAARRWAY